MSFGEKAHPLDSDEGSDNFDAKRNKTYSEMRNED